jgi:hypothetical protein
MPSEALTSPALLSQRERREKEARGIEILQIGRSQQGQLGEI